MIEAWYLLAGFWGLVAVAMMAYALSRIRWGL